MNFRYIIFAVNFLFFLSPAYAAQATCFCNATWQSNAGQTSAHHVFWDLTSAVGTTYSAVFPQAENFQQNCAHLCGLKISQLGIQAFKNQACSSAAAAGYPSDTYQMHLSSRVGVKKFRSAGTLGNVSYGKEQKTTYYMCPVGWMPNSPVSGFQQASLDPKCKRLAGSITGLPLPGNGTPIGASWGMTWGNEVWQWGSPIGTQVVIQSPQSCS